MKILIISSAPIILIKGKRYAYGPYVEELVLWAKQVDDVQFACPIWNSPNGLLIRELPFENSFIELTELTKKTKYFFHSLSSIIKNVMLLYNAMRASDHIHLRCPGNMGLLGAIIQILFPHKPKTAKYAGNWDPKSKQPFSYRMQKWILSNTWLTKNMQVLVYGEWPNQSKNVKAFFTATYNATEFENVRIDKSIEDQIKCIFVGTLTANKRPLLAAKVVQKLYEQGYKVQLTYYGDGPERHAIENFVLDYNLQQVISLKGNVAKDVLIKAYQKAHMLLFFSKSEGWPKAIAEAMAWGCVPLATSVSCVPMMLDQGNRGVLVNTEINSIVSEIEKLIKNPTTYKQKSKQAITWSRQFTLEKFEEAIGLLLKATDKN